MTSTAEHELLSQIRRGNQAALGMLLEAQQGRLYGVILRMVANRDDAAELTQDTLLKIIQNIGSYRGEAALSTWMVRIAMNQAISHLRKRKLRRAVSLDAGPAGANNNGDDQATVLRHRLADQREPSPEQRVQTREMTDRLLDAVAGLDDEFRAVIVLRDFDQMDYQQIAEVLDLKIGTVKSRLFRARLALREQLQRADQPADEPRREAADG